MHKYMEVGKKILVWLLIVCMMTGLMPQLQLTQVYAAMDISTATVTLWQDADYTQPVATGADASAVYTYTGDEIRPYVKVVDTTGVVGKDNYILLYTDNVNAGTASVTVTGLGEYQRSKTVTFPIGKAILANITPTCQYQENGIRYCYYDGNTSDNNRPVVTDVNATMASGGASRHLEAGTDYTINYYNNTAACVDDTSQKRPYFEVALLSGSNYRVDGDNQKYYYRIYYNMNSDTVSAGGVGSLTFNGGAQTPVPTLSDTLTGGNIASNNYTYSWSNNTDAGTATLSVYGTNQYKGSKSFSFPIAKAAITSDNVKLSQTEFAYINSTIPLDSYITVKLGDYTVPASNYTLTYSSNWGKVGTNYVTVTGQGNIQGSVRKSFLITNSLKRCIVSTPEVTYTGAVAKPTLRIIDHLENEITETSKYTITYYTDASYTTPIVSPTEVGTYYIKVKGVTDAFMTGELGTPADPISYKIIPKSMASDTMSFALNGRPTDKDTILGFTYSGKSIQPKLTIKDSGRTGNESLVENTDYTVKYYGDAAFSQELTSTDQFVNAGDYYIRVTGINTYDGSVYDIHYQVTPKILQNVTMTVADQTYTGSEVIPAKSAVTVKDTTVNVTLTEDDFEIIGCANNVNLTTDSSKAIVYIHLVGNYTTNTTLNFNGKDYSGAAMKEFEITPKKISECDSNLVAGSPIYDASQLSFVYNGTNQIPTVIIRDENRSGNKVLTEGTDYEVRYYTNENCTSEAVDRASAGDYWVKIRGLGIYASDATDADIKVKYTITGKPLDAAGMTVNVDNVDKPDGATFPVITVKDGTDTLTENKDYRIVGYYRSEDCDPSSVWNFTDAGQFYVSIAGKGNYSAAPVVKSFYVGTDIAGVVSSVKVNGAPFTYNQKSHRQEILTGIHVYDAAENEISSGDYTVELYSDEAHKVNITNVVDNSSYINAGTIYIGIKGRGPSGYYGTYYGSCQINKQDIAQLDYVVAGTYTYDGTRQGLEIYDPAAVPAQSAYVQLRYPATSTLSGTILNPSDYTIDTSTYENNINAGTASVTLVGRGNNYTGMKKVSFTIGQKDISTLTNIDMRVEEATYTSQLQVPTVHVTYGDNAIELAKDSDYKVSYYTDAGFNSVATNANLTNAGTTYVKVEGRGNYKGTLNLTGKNAYIINKRNISETTISLAGLTYVYSAVKALHSNPVIPDFTVKYEYTPGSSYVLRSNEFTTNSVAENYYYGKQNLTITANASGNFTGSKTVDYYYQGNFDNDAGEVTVSGLTPTVQYTPSMATSGYQFSNISVHAANNGGVLPASSYTVEYQNNTSAGTATVLIRGNNDEYWTGTYKYEFKIVGTITDAQITIPDQVYTGTAYTKDTIEGIEVVCDGYNLQKNVDYEITGVTGTTDALTTPGSGTPGITIKGIGDYFTTVGDPTKSATFAIKYPMDNSKFVIGDGTTPVLTYTGSPVTLDDLLQTIEYKKADGTTTTLTRDVDYSVEYFNNTAVCAASGTSGPYAAITALEGGLLMPGVYNFAFGIGKVNLEDGYVIDGITDDQEFAYTGEVIKPVFTVKKGDKVVDPSNYSVAYTSLAADAVNKNKAGTSEKITVTGIGENYSGSISVTIKIVKRNIDVIQDENDPGDGVKVSISDLTYNGTAQTPSFDVTFKDYSGATKKLKAGSDYAILGYHNNTNASEADPDSPHELGPYVTISAPNGSNCEGTINVPFTILPKAMDKLVYSNVADMVYDSAQSNYDPELTVKMSRESTTNLVKDQDYILTYVNDDRVGSKNGVNGPHIKVEPASTNFVGEKIIDYAILAKSLNTEDYRITYSDPMNDKFDAARMNYPYEAGQTYRPLVTIVDNAGTDHEVTLEEGVDYSVSYANNNVVTEDATITITGMNNYKDSRPAVKFSIGTLFTSNKITVYQNNSPITEVASVTYDGKDKAPKDISVKLNNPAKELVEGTDYVISYYKDAACTEEAAEADRINAGKIYMAVKGLTTAGYIGKMVLPFTIKQKSIMSNDIVPTAIPDQTYGGGNVRPSVVLTDKSVGTLVPTSAYSVTYTNNNKIGTAYAVVTANENGNYTGSRSISFVIKEENISGATVNTIADQYYTGKAITPNPEVYFNGTRLVKGVDYKVTVDENFGDNIKAGIGTILIQGMGNYKGTKAVSFKIRASLQNATISTVTNQLYTGKEIKPSVTVTCGGRKLEKGTDYTISYLNNVKIGDAFIIIEPKDDSVYSGSRVVKFAICNSIDQATITGIPTSQTYTKSVIAPEPVVKVGNTKLKKGTDYTVKWKNDINVGTASVTVTGVGKYAGSKTVTYKIIAKGISRCSVSKVTDQNYTGKTQKPLVTIKDGSKVLAKNVDYTISYSHNKKIGTATITIKGKGNYSGTFKRTFKIVSATITGLKASAQKTTSVKLSWSKKSKITGYQVYTNNSRTRLTQQKGTSYTIKNLKAGKTYKYKVRTYTVVGKKTYYGSFATITFATAPKEAAASAKASGKKAVKVSWKKVSGASGYEIYYATSKNGTFKKAATVIRGNVLSYTNTKLTKGKTYYYKVRAYRMADGKKAYGSFSAVVSAKAK